MKTEPNEKELEKLLAKLAKENGPSKHFSQTLLSKLKKEHQTNMPKKGLFIANLFKIKFQLANLVVLLVLGSTTIYAYNSPNVINGHILYPIKKTIEEIEGKIISTPEGKNEYYYKMASRRIDEIAVLKSKNIFDERTMSDLQFYLDKAQNDQRNIALIALIPQIPQVPQTTATLETETYDLDLVEDLTKATAEDAGRDLADDLDDYSAEDSETFSLMTAETDLNKSVQDLEEKIKKISEELEKIELENLQDSPRREELEKLLEETKKQLKEIKEEIEALEVEAL